MTELGNPEHAGWFADARRVIDVAEVTPGLPLPAIGSTTAAFNYTGIAHPEDAAEAVAAAETILSYALDVTFEYKDTPRIGSAAHYVLAGFMKSGLEVDIVAKAEHMAARRIPQAQPELAVAS